MGFIVFEEEAFNYLDALLENFVKRMDRIRERSEDKTMNKWLDTQDVCHRVWLLYVVASFYWLCRVCCVCRVFSVWSV